MYCKTTLLKGTKSDVGNKLAAYCLINVDFERNNLTVSFITRRINLADFGLQIVNLMKSFL